MIFQYSFTLDINRFRSHAENFLVEFISFQQCQVVSQHSLLAVQPTSDILRSKQIFLFENNFGKLLIVPIKDDAKQYKLQILGTD